MVPFHVVQKREILVRVIRAFMGKNFGEDVAAIAGQIGSDGNDATSDCRADRRDSIRRELVMVSLGIRGNRQGDTPLSQLAESALQMECPDENVLSVVKCACNGCDSHMRVTNVCQNCPAKPCIHSCKFGSIRSTDGGSVIDSATCKKCGLCLRACPYGAIVKTVIPCESVCPVKAISKDANGLAEVDFDRCIGCGKCIGACPFGAIHAKSQVINVLQAIKTGKKVVALVAPSIFGQFKCSPEQLHSAIKKAGFSLVYEVSVGAESTSTVEAEELRERLERGDKFMTSSCCAAYNALVDKHIGELKPFVSTAGTPLFYTAELVRDEHSDAVLVFVSPCLAKYREAFMNEKISYAINFEELYAIFDAMSIDVEAGEGEIFDRPSAKEAKEFGISGGVATAVLSAYNGDRDRIKVAIIDGIDAKVVGDLKRFGKTGECDVGNMLEVMSCTGGCIGGAMALCPLKASKEQIKNYAEKSESLDPSKKNIP